MAARLTDKERKEIIAERAEGLSIRQLASKYNVSTTTIQKTLRRDPELTQRVTQKKEQNTADILAHMEAKRDKVCEIMDVYLDALLNEEKVEKAKLSELTTALGTLIDKFTGNGRGIGDHQEADGLSRSLEEMAKGLKSDVE